MSQQQQAALRTREGRLDLPTPLPLRLRLGGWAERLGWPEVCKDLVEVASAVLLADRRVTRPRLTLGPRRISLSLPVRQPRLWEKAAPHMSEALEVLGGDRFDFEFYERLDGASCFPDRASGQMSFNFPGRASVLAAPRVERVALFSGGLDSVAAAASFAAQGASVAYVTHYVYGIGRLENLLRGIYKAYGVSGHQPQHAQFHIKPVGGIVRELRENSRRSRSFLFVSLALATAFACGAREVCVCENGVLALNLPLIPAMIPTRHAHSLFLKVMERLAHTLFDESIRVVNPFELTTKGEMSRIFTSRHEELALASISCWNQQWSGRGGNYGKGHCGYCIPCLVRRVSLHASDIGWPKGHFDVDVRSLSKRRRLSEQDLHRLGAYKALLGFAASVRSCRSWKSFLNRFPDAISAEPTYKLYPTDRWFKKLYSMMRRFSLEVEAAFETE
jgi:7-cyano-7-deazaguanine synthase in queuosine biosynthesis